MKATSFYLDAMDPGGTTGLLVLRVEPDNFTVADQRAERYLPEQGISPVSVLKAWRAQYDDLPHVLVYENFHVRPRRQIPDTTALNILGELDGWLAEAAGQNGPVAEALELVAALDRRSTRDESECMLLRRITELLHDADIPGGRKKKPSDRPYTQVVTQEPVHAKRLVTDAVLYRLGLKALGPNSAHINDAARHAVTWLTAKRYMPVCRKGWPRTA